MASLDAFLTIHWRKSLILVFLVGLLCHSVVFIGPHAERDEQIYTTLVDQLESGRGYTLQGSWLLKEGLLDSTGYDRPLFFHPPGGAALNWLFFKAFGYWGFPLVQLCSYALFFWSMLLLAKAVQPLLSGTGLMCVAALAAFSPIMMHVTTKIWLDGPLLAFTTAATAVYVAVLAKGRGWQVFVAGILLGYASLIKMTAFLVVPGIIGLTLSLLRPMTFPVFSRNILLFLAPAVLVQLPWEIYQWHLLGTPFPGWAGKPSAALIAANPYIYQVTVVNSPWMYLTTTPLILWTLTPGIVFLLLFGRRAASWSVSLSLLAWILVIVLFHVFLGFIGYSKVSRYIILVTPAVILLFAAGVDQGYRRLKELQTGQAALWLKGSLALAAVAFILEIFTGVFAAVSYDKVLP